MRHAALQISASIAAAIALGMLLPVTGLAEDVTDAAPRVVAVGDVHGSYEGLTTILRATGLIDRDNRWIGGNATLVQTGDLLDRGVGLQEVMNLLMTLQKEALRAGGRVHVLLGNHETMNLVGITRDVNRDAYAEFVDEQSSSRRAAALQRYEEHWRRRMSDLGQQPGFSDEAREQWLALHPPGFIEYAEAFGPNGSFGRWLRKRPAAVVIDDSLFIHGGYGPHLTGRTVADINRSVRQELATFDRTRAWMVEEGLALPWSSVHEMIREAQRELEFLATHDSGRLESKRMARADSLQLQWSSWLLLHPEGPFWFRGLARWDEADRGMEMAALLDGLGVARQVVGHTPQAAGQIQTRFDGRAFLIDTGMLASVYKGRPSALEIVGDVVVAVYPGERHVLVDGDSTSRP